MKLGKAPQVTGEDGRNALKVATMVEDAIKKHLTELKTLRPGAKLPGE